MSFVIFASNIAVMYSVTCMLSAFFTSATAEFSAKTLSSDIKGEDYLYFLLS